jgi:hypothetical protein
MPGSPVRPHPAEGESNPVLPQRARRLSMRYASGPTGWTKQPSSQSGLGPRIWLAGRRARSTSAVAVKANSTEANARISARWVGVKSLHRFFDAMIQNNAKRPQPLKGELVGC